LVTALAGGDDEFINEALAGRNQAINAHMPKHLLSPAKQQHTASKPKAAPNQEKKGKSGWLW
jgi:hypothetical protein